MNLVEGPVFKHDCEFCEYIFSIEVNGRKADVYRCAKSMGGEVYRTGDESSDYTTMLGQLALDLRIRESQIRTFLSSNSQN